MRVLSHRGFWKTGPEKNSREAMLRSFSAGFGTETDIRDLDGELVISHDPPRSVDRPMTVAELLSDFVELGGREAGLPLALNIKCDGLAGPLADLLAGHDVTTGYVFDMSVPDHRSYLSDGRIPSYCRHSDVEAAPAYYAESVGVWLDSFGDDAWIDADLVRTHVDAGKQVCVVSSELHGRDPSALWARLAAAAGSPGGGGLGDAVGVCTDRPDELAALLGAGGEAR